MLGAVFNELSQENEWVKEESRQSKKLMTDFYGWGIQNLVPRLNKSLHNACDYVKKNIYVFKKLIVHNF